jgi:hypothetical protein
MNPDGLRPQIDCATNYRPVISSERVPIIKKLQLSSSN